METKPTYEMLEQKIKSLESTAALMASLQKQVKLNDSFLEMLFNTIPNPIFYKDREGVYQNCNDAFSKGILGIPKEEIIGRSLYEFPDQIPKELADIYYEKDQELFATPGTQYYEGKVKCADGVTCYYNFYKATFMSETQEVLGIVGVMLDISDHKKTLEELDDKNRALSRLSITDALSEVYNRRYFEDIFQKKLNLLNRHKQPFALMIIDIDYFKNYNDVFGHQLGDTALQNIAKTIKEVFCRPNDYVFRLGGEEFGVVFHFNKIEQAVELAQELIQKAEDQKIESGLTTVSPYVTISAGLGILRCIGEADLSGEHIYNKVDQLLYHSKENGRNQLSYKVMCSATCTEK
ncbi:MAG: diguanylate cyclase [Campylobacterota bacterium]